MTQETADEGQGGAEPPSGHSQPGAAQPGAAQPGAAQANGPASPRVTTVKDLMLSVIEVSLMKTQSAASDSAPPTISSILGSESSFVGRDLRPAPPAEKVVTNSHHAEPPKDAANAHHPDLPKEGLVVLQVSKRCPLGSCRTNGKLRLASQFSFPTVRLIANECR